MGLLGMVTKTWTKSLNASLTALLSVLLFRNRRNTRAKSISMKKNDQKRIFFPKIKPLSVTFIKSSSIHFQVIAMNTKNLNITTVFTS